MKYKGHELPEWAKWVARDVSNRVHCFKNERKPEPCKQSGLWGSDGICMYLFTEENPTVNWLDSLIDLSQLKEEKLMIELNKTYKDGLGRDVRIICIDRKDNMPIVGLHLVGDEEWLITYTAEGHYCMDERSQNDLIIPEDFTKFEIDEPTKEELES